MMRRPLIRAFALLLASITAIGATSCFDKPPPKRTTDVHVENDPPKTNNGGDPPKTNPGKHHHPSHEHAHGSHPHASNDHHHHPHPHPHLDGQNHHHPY